MKINQLLFILLILFLQSTAFAEEKYLYLQGQSEYPVREYERNGNIMGMIPIGAKVKILRSGNDSVVVEYAPGKGKTVIGWISKRFLSKEKPVQIAFNQLNKTHESLMSEYNKIKQEDKVFKDKFNQMSSQLSDCNRKLSQMEAYKEKASQLDVAEKNQKELKRENELLKDRLKEIQIKVNALQSTKSYWIWGIILGALASFIGYYIGYWNMKKIRRVL
ncbi:peptide-binding protein [Candidatus Magnetomorum sp. HK-1]|nr:peptide-binding protein [Candidatus Magnetomorum sp. HK-1]